MNQIIRTYGLRVFSALVLLSLTGCHALPKHQTHSVCAHGSACDEMVGCDLGCEGDSPGCDGSCDLGCDSWDDDGCDAYPGMISNRIVRGRPNSFLDGCGSIFGFANKLALWDKRADCHKISPHTEREVLSYLHHHRLDTVLVRSNQYDPVGEWGRLMANDRIAPGWKYTFGTYDWLKYTLLPGRLVGGDWYNPFTDTVHLYSDIPSIGLAKAAYARDVHGRTYPGTYAAGQDAPLLGLWHESLANTEVLRYLGENGDATRVAEAKRILYPDFGGALGAQVLGFLPYGNVYGRAAGAMAGHAYRGVTESDTFRQATGRGSSKLR